MIAERRVWMILRDMEKKANGSVIAKDDLISEVLKRSKDFFCFVVFLNKNEVLRTISSLVSMRKAYHKDFSRDGVFTVGIETEASGDDYFFFPRFINLLAEEIGFWRIVGGIILVISFVPNGFAYRLLDLVILIIDRIHG